MQNALGFSQQDFTYHQASNLKNHFSQAQAHTAGYVKQSRCCIRRIGRVMSRFLKIVGLVGLISLIHCGAALALDVPHAAPESVKCSSCHTLHNYLGSNLTNQPTNAALCKSCHTLTGTASALPFASFDQAKPGVSGTSHSWSGLMPAISNPSNAYGLRATADLTNLGVKRRVSEAGNAVICSACHDEHSQLNLPWDPMAVSTSRGQTGTATGGTASTLVDTSKAWTENQWANATVKIMSGLNSGLVKRVLSNTANQLTFQTSFPNSIGANTSYYLNSNRHFMRVTNTADQLCLDCHYYRNQSDVTTYTGTPLSHPIRKALTAAKDPTQFFNIPREPQSAGFVPQAGTRGELNGGTDTNLKNNIVLASDLGILCLSCHDMHYTGSSDGYLLKRSLEETCHACHKTDVNTPNDANAIKTHNSTNAGSTKWGGDGWGITGGKYGKFGCTTCHTAHSTKNIFLIKENIVAPNSPTDALPGAAADLRVFSGTAGSTPGLLADDTGGHSTSTRACELCHSRNKYHNFDTANNTGGNDHYNANDCRSCHSHKNGFRPLCDGCHGTPPSLNTIGGPNGLATPSSGSGTAGAHYYHAKTVAYPCGWCHYNASGSGPLHKDSKVSLGFVNLFGSKTGGSYNGQASVNYESTDPGTSIAKTGSKTCALYCHGSTMIPNGGTSTNAVWDAGASAYSCSSSPNGSCHGASSANPPQKGSHGKHVSAALGYGFGCNLCHPAVTGGSHVDGKVSWSFNTTNTTTNGGKYKGLPVGSTGAPAPSATYGTCSTLYCHSTGTSSPTYATPEWGNAASGLCGSCHGVTAGSPPASGAHAKHTGDAAAYRYSCSKCHNSVANSTTNSSTQPTLKTRTLHVNGEKDVQFDSGQAGAYSNGVCSNTYCHSDGTAASTGVIRANTSPAWGATGSQACNSCHGYPPSYPSGSPKANSHLHHNWDCGMCHAWTTPHGERISSPWNHANGVIDVHGSGTNGHYFTFTPNPNGGGTCSGTFCHYPAQWGAREPAAPTMLEPEALSTTKIRWNLKDNSWNENGFDLDYHAPPVRWISVNTPNISFIEDDGLTPNTQYSAHLHAYSSDDWSTSSNYKTICTLALPPEVTSDRIAGTSFTTQSVVFTNVTGFGSGGLQYYRYVWDQNPTHTFTDTEPLQWSSGTLSLAAIPNAGMYLHLKSYNCSDVPSGTLDLGPFYYTPNAVYYSVGQNTSDHKTGTPTVTVSGKTATFSVAQTATNMGVGDVITYGGSNKCYISGKISGTVWTCTSAKADTPVQATNATVNSITHAFGSVSNAVYGATTPSYLGTSDLVIGNYQLNIPCYYDSGPSDTASSLYLTGIVTGPGNHIKIYTPVNTASECNRSQRHDGKWKTDAFRIENADTAVIYSNLNHIEFEGLQIASTRGGAAHGISNQTQHNASVIRIHDNIISHRNIRGGTGILILDDAGGIGVGGKAYIYNNIIYDFGFPDTGWEGYGIRSYMDGVLYNNTVYNCYYGIYGTSLWGSPAPAAKNNIVQGSVLAGYTGTYAASSANNISSDATSPNSAFRNKTVTFVNAVGKDFHLSAGDTVARDAGVNLSADVALPLNTDINGRFRPYGSAWDIGADEYAVKSVFYSVGQNTSDHKTGTPTVTVWGNTAIFSVPQTASNMGVGDVVTYGGSYKCYISGKTSQSEWSCVSATGGIPAPATEATVNSITHAYASLSAAVNGASDANHLNTSNLMTGNYILNLPCYYDTGADTTPVFVTAYATDWTHYIRIYTPTNTATEVNASQRHKGKWDAQKYTLSGAGMLHLNAGYTQVIGLQVESIGNQDNDWLITNDSPWTATSLTIANNMLRSSNTAGVSNRGIYLLLANGQNKIYNNIISDFGYSGIYVESGNAGTVFAYNNTVVNCKVYGIGTAVPSIILAKNNIVQGSSTGYSGTFAAGSDYNLSDQANDAPSPSYRTNQATTVSFADAENGDFHLSDSETAAIDAGANLSADANISFNSDIDGQARPHGSGWDIGADEFIESIAPSSTISAPENDDLLGPVNPYTISGTATDNSAVAGIEVSIDGGNWFAATCAGCPGANVAWTYSWPLPADGSHTIRSRATDSANNVEIPGTGVTVTVDKTPPLLTIGQPSVTATTHGPVTYALTYTDASSINLTAEKVILNRTGTASGTVSVTGAGNTRTVTISEIAGDGTLGISIASGTAVDISGNTVPTTGPSATFTVDNTAPTLSIGSASLFRTTSGPVTYTVTYSGADTVTLAPEHITLNKTGTANGVVSVSGSDNTTRIVAISDTTGDGTLGISIAAGSASDFLGHPTPSAGPSGTFIVSQPPKPIYYSVGQNLNDHRTGSPTVTVSGKTATFSVAQTATNMGVGDVVTYGGTNKCYISGKISQTQWSCVSATGGTPVAATDAPVNSITHAFSSLASAITGAADVNHLNTTDLVAGNYILNIPCYYDSGPDGSTPRITFNTIPDNYIRIYTPTNTLTEVNKSQRHKGKWTSTAYRMELGYTAVINATDTSFIEIDGLQIQTTGTAIGISSTVNSSVIKIHDNIIVGPGTGSAGIYVSDNNTGTGGTAHIYNNIVYGFLRAGQGVGGEGYGIMLYLHGTLYNNTVLNSDYGIYTYSYPVAKNNLVQNCTNGYYRLFDASSSNNISQDASSPNAELRNKTVTFLNAAAGDFHLSVDDTVAKDAGADLSADPIKPFNTDADGQTRPFGSGWDIGADEFVETPPVSVITAPLSDMILGPENPYTIAGTANDDLGVTGIEVSTDGGSTWNAAVCTGCPGTSVTWNYSWALPDNGYYTLKSRATDSWANVEVPGAGTTISIDKTNPVMNIGAPSLSSTRNTPVAFTVTYGGAETVTLATGDITLNKTGTANGTVSVSGSGLTRTVTVSGITGDGTLGITIAAGTARNSIGNLALAGSSTTFSVDNNPPAMSIGAPSATSTGSGPITYTVAYSGANAITLVPANITLNKTGTANGTISVSGTDNISRTVTISNTIGNGTLGISIASGTATDVLGNPTVSAGPSATFTVANSQPTIGIGAPSKTTTATGPVSYTLTYLDAVSITLASGDVSLNKTGTADGTVAVSGSGNSTRTVTISGITGEGTLGISILAGTAVDGLGRPAFAAGPSTRFDVDRTAPTLSIGDPSASSTKTGPVSYTVSYLGADAITLAPANITLNKTGSSNGTVAVTGSGNTERTVTISGMAGQGTVGISIAAGTASDLAGNTAAGAGPSTTFIQDSVAPTLSISAPSNGFTDSAPVSYTVTYAGADSITLAPADVTLNKTGNANGIVEVSGTGNTTRTVTITNITGHGTIGISLAAGTASDTTGNAAAAAGPSGTFIVSADVRQVYYSAGQNTNDHKTGNPTVTISGKTATFSVDQTATNMGVGDVVTYGGTNKCYISGKTSQSVWTCVSATGDAPVAATDATVDSITHAFASLSAALTGASDANHLNTTDLVTNSYILNIPCYYDTGRDTTTANVLGYSTGIGNYIKIYAPNNTSTEVNRSQRHQGMQASDVYTLQGTLGDNALAVGIPYVRIVGLHITNYGGNNSYGSAIKLTNNVRYVTIEGNLIHDPAPLSYGTTIGVTNTGSGGFKVFNNIVYNVKYGVCIDHNSGVPSYVYNNLVYNSQYAFTHIGGTEAVFRNNIGQSCSYGCYAMNATSGSDYNISGDSYTPGGSHSKPNTMVSFVDAAGLNFHLAPSDTAAKDAGMDLSADTNLAFNTDINGQVRPVGGTWDIGPFEAPDTSAAASTITTPLDGAVIGSSAPSPYTISGTATDNASVSEMFVSTDGGASWSQAACQGCPGKSVTWTYSWTLPVDGFYTLRSRATDNVGNVETPGAGNTVAVQRTAPLLRIGAPSKSLTNTGPVTYTVSYVGAETVTLAPADITIHGTGTAMGTVAVSGSGNSSRTVTFSDITGSGTLGISIVAATASDSLGNTAPSAGPSTTFTVDNSRPTPSISAPSTSLTGGTPVTYTVTYSGADAVTLAAGDITLNKTGTADAGTVEVSGSGNTARTVTVSNFTGDGTLGISIAAGTASDIAGNTATGAGPSTTFEVDTSAPAITIGSPSPTSTANGPVTYTVTYSGAETVTLAAGDITLNKTGTADGSLEVSGSDNTTRSVTISGITGNGTIGISIGWGTASDAVGNIAVNSGPSEICTVSNSPPAIYYSVGQDMNDHKTGSPYVTISGTTATFTEDQTATNMGVGDVVTYITPDWYWRDCYISGKISPSVWSCVSATGGTPEPATGAQVSTIRHAFSGLAAAVGGAGDSAHLNTKDLVAGNYQLNFPCYYDSGPDTAGTPYLDYWTTGPNNFIKIYTPTDTSTEVNQSQRHQGKWSYNAYSLVNGNNDVLTVMGTNYVEIAGLQIMTTGAGIFNKGIYSYTSSQGLVKIHDNIITSFNPVGAKGMVLSDSGVGAAAQVYNNILYNFQGSAEGRGIVVVMSSGAVYNNTVDKCDYGIFTPRGAVLKNNIVQDSGTNYAGTFDPSSANNISQDATSPNTGFWNRTVAFADASTSRLGDEPNDFHLAGTDTAAIDKGADLSADSVFAFATDIDGQTRPGGNAWDIGADESKAIQVYYSVGQNMDDHKTGSPTVTVSGQTATFSVPQTATNMGVGDVVNYSPDGYSWYTCYISGKITQSQWSCVSVTGGMPVSATNATVGSISHVFSSLAWATSGAGDWGHLQTYDLVTGKYALNIPCYYDTGPDTAAYPSVSGYNTSASNYINIYTPTNVLTEVNKSQRHKGMATGDAYSLIIPWGDGLQIYNPNVKVAGLQISGFGGVGYSTYGIRAAAANITLEGNLIYDEVSGNNGAGIGVTDWGTTGNVKIFNNIVYSVRFGMDIQQWSGYGLSYVYNNTVNGCDIAYQHYNSQALLKNNIAQSTTTWAYYGYFATGSDYNISDLSDSYATTGGEHDKSSAVVNFVDPAGRNFHLSPTDPYAVFAGANLAADPYLPFTTDIDGQTRRYEVPWDIGADEYKE